MNQDDIYNLLLLILLMSNEKDGCPTDCRSTRSSLNELIIASLLMSSCNSRDTALVVDNLSASSCRRCPDGNTTF